ncbi:glycosyltransferase family 61 protein [Sphingomonas piscis]|uniref:Glycosyltransferase family 61 protein n=1 Tax=Sphingomonas piscis TaxID=2714943 RepID=A0A6G7YSE7_9SPHN|nr:glycosyltransferase 61 family protein [Sphingomonas piscis]QIK79666.1 glycosyltransferase family 61 protein [Sphingomonas piscis]
MQTFTSPYKSKGMGRRHFYGFAPGEAEHRLKKVVQRPDPGLPLIHKLHEVIAIPGLASLYTTEGHRIDEAAEMTLSPAAPARLKDKLRVRPKAEVGVPANLNIIDGPVLFAGHLTPHYGHFLIDSMSRLWARDMFPKLPVLFTRPPVEDGWRQFSRDVFDALGLSARIIPADEPTLFREVVCPGTSFEYRWKAFSVADEPHTAAARKLNSGARGWRRPVYLSRTGLPDASDVIGKGRGKIRRSDAEPELEAELSRRGFDVVRPETLRLCDQISLFEQAPLILGIIGSALHTALFSQFGRANIAVITWGRGFENCLLIDSLKEHRSFYIKSIGGPNEEREHSLDVALTIRLLEQAGLVSTRTQVGLTASRPLRCRLMRIYLPLRLTPVADV